MTWHRCSQGPPGCVWGQALGAGQEQGVQGGGDDGQDRGAGGDSDRVR